MPWCFLLSWFEPALSVLVGRFQQTPRRAFRLCAEFAVAERPAVAGAQHVGLFELGLRVVVGAVQDPRLSVRVVGPEYCVRFLHAGSFYLHPAPAEREAGIGSECVKYFHVVASFLSADTAAGCRCRARSSCSRSRSGYSSSRSRCRSGPGRFLRLCGVAGAG